MEEYDSGEELFITQTPSQVIPETQQDIFSSDDFFGVETDSQGRQTVQYVDMSNQVDNSSYVSSEGLGIAELQQEICEGFVPLMADYFDDTHKVTTILCLLLFLCILTALLLFSILSLLLHEL